MMTIKGHPSFFHTSQVKLRPARRRHASSSAGFESANAYFENAEAHVRWCRQLPCGRTLFIPGTTSLDNSTEKASFLILIGIGVTSLAYIPTPDDIGNKICARVYAASLHLDYSQDISSCTCVAIGTAVGGEKASSKPSRKEAKSALYVDQKYERGIYIGQDQAEEGQELEGGDATPHLTEWEPYGPVRMGTQPPFKDPEFSKVSF